ncbi:MAG: hypothetical protein HY904_14675 [Deltaproteobacteria bacterium]|nr:hypothetical protein [Deltaproteobacteria bacterium]
MSHGRVCRRCLNYAGMRFFLNPRHVPARILAHLALDEDGVCSVCRAYARERVEPLHAALAQHVRERLHHGEPALVLCSGGKDSVATSALVRGLSAGPVVGFLYDNGFIPAAVVERAAVTLEQLGVPLLVGRPQEPARRAFASLVLAPDPSAPPPCEACAQAMVLEALHEVDALEATLLITGSNYWAAWTDQPLPAVGLRTPGGRDVLLVHLPYLLGRTRADTLDLLGEFGFAPAQMAGVSSNCRVPALVQERVSQDVGHVPELEDLSLEVLVGHLTRAEAIRELYAKAPAQRRLLDGLFGGER